MFGKLCWVSVLSFCVLFALPALSAPNTIAPGRSIGRIHLGDLRDNIVRQIGREPDGGDAASGQAISAWFAKGKRGSELEVWTSYYVNFPDGRPNTRNLALVEQVRVTSPYFRTLTGLGVGSRWQQLAKVFPKAKQVRYFINSANKRVDLYDDSASGIAFEVVRQNKRAAEGTCGAILVHAKNASVLSTGLRFYPSENGKPLEESYLKSAVYAVPPTGSSDAKPYWSQHLIAFGDQQSTASDAERWLARQVPNLDHIEFYSRDEYPRNFIDVRSADFAVTHDKVTMRRIIGSLHCQGSLTNGKMTPLQGLPTRPTVHIWLYSNNGSKDQLVIWEGTIQGYYRMARLHTTTRGYRPTGVAVLSQDDLLNFFHFLRSLAFQARHGSKIIVFGSSERDG